MSRPANKDKYNLNKLLHMHLDNLRSSEQDTTNELEIRFGTKGIKNITKIDFMNVITKLKSLKYKVAYGNEQGLHSLKIFNKFINTTGRTSTSRYRTEINGLHNIQDYCNSASIDSVMKNTSSNVSLISKNDMKGEDGQKIDPVDVNAFNFRISYQSETTVSTSSNFGKKIISEIDSSKKMFRLMNRVSFIHPSYPVRVDLSIVKTSSYDTKTHENVWTYNMKDSNVLTNPERYEIEIEVLNHLLGPGTTYEKANIAQLEADIKMVITHILSGLQSTNYPVSYVEQNNIKSEYLSLLYGKEQNRQVFTNDFCGPSSYTLQMKHIQELSENVTSPNIRNFYTVTEKADGMRKLLYINGKGKIYLITTGMQVQYTGISITNKKLYNSLLDGEHILHNKKGQFINYYGAFDIYYINGRSVREKSFMYIEETDMKENYRLPLLIQFVEELDIKKESKDMEYPIHIKNKNFLIDTTGQNIFANCGELLKRINSNYFEYETDGIIFTPIKNGVAGDKAGEAGSLRKPTWVHSFKWKPPKFNTIDFLITTKKTESNMDVVGNIFNGGLDLSSQHQISQYKVIELRVGFDVKQHGFLNPCNDVINDTIPTTEVDENENTYKPTPFYPTNPSDPETHICRILLKQDESGTYQMMTEEGEVFDDKTIVEFRYDFTREKYYRWVPLRVRYDKTTEFRNNMKEYGNAYNVANSNWYSIHNPISEEMLGTGDGIPTDISEDGVYYNRKGDRSIGQHTTCMRDFHNKYVKKRLIMGVSKRGNTLIDLAVGQGGDLMKWVDAKLDFVFGIDISPDNIENMLVGACARYLNKRKELKVMPKALFVNGNSGKNVRNGDALFNEKDKMITNAIFGNGPKDAKQLGKGVYNQYGKGSQGFNISSCQFALHYFFEDKDKLYSFITNICETTKLNGYFIGTCYDGKKIFNRLKTKLQDESMILMSGDVKIWEVSKMYNRTEFKDDITSVGYGIKVYQESINKSFTEYLVNFDYFIRVMEQFGFIPLAKDESKTMGFPSSIGSFEELYNELVGEVKRNRHVEKDYGCSLKMTSEEKQISFYNNYFVFKKIREVDPTELKLADDNPIEDVVNIEKIVESVVDSKPITKPKTNKRTLKTKLVDKNASK